MKTHIVLCVAAALCAAACAEGLDGAPGPGGEMGAPGDPGPDGNDGAQGQDGATPNGADGLDGIDCWDDGNGVCDPAEDLDLDGMCSVADCVGPSGPEGPTGAPGPGQIQSCSHYGAQGSSNNGGEEAACGSGERLTGAFCSCPNGVGKLSEVLTVPAENFGGSLFCACVSGSVKVDVLCCS